MNRQDDDFDAVVREHRDNVYRLAWRLTGNRQDALEVTQETFLAAYRFRERFRGEAKMSTYLHRITANISFTLLKNRRKKSAWPLEATPEAPSRGPNPAQAFDRAELAREAGALIDRLPPRQKAALHLRLYQELPFEEIASILGCRPATARTLYFFGIRKLRAALAENRPRPTGAGGEERETATEGREKG